MEWIKKTFFKEDIDLKDLYKKSSVILVDVRSKEEYEEDHINNSRNIPLLELQNTYESLEKNKTYFFYCVSGARSGHAVNFLKNKGFSFVYNTINLSKTKEIIL
jgi:rhodanese-related sulfurtransferase